MTAEEEVEARVARTFAGDRFAKLIGAEVEEASDSLSRVSAVVTEDVLNALMLAHGAFVFALADIAFALTVNARSDAVAVQWSLNQFRSGRPGERLTAECRPLHAGRRLRVVELVVTGEDGRVLAKGQATAIPVDGMRGSATGATGGADPQDG
jgi:acyl-CoA thioesterase